MLSHSLGLLHFLSDALIEVSSEKVKEEIAVVEEVNGLIEPVQMHIVSKYSLSYRKSYDSWGLEGVVNS